MRHGTRVLLLAAVSMGFAMGCQKPTQEDSEVEHAFGKTSNQRLKPLESCKKMDAESKSKELKLANEYVKKIAERIFSRNLKSSKVFTGFLAPENFCVGVEKDTTVNAYADPSSGYIRVLAGLILMAENDAQIAGVIGHEMAHVTMNHERTVDVFAERLSPAEYTQAREDERKIDASEAEIDPIIGKLVEVLAGAKIDIPSSAWASGEALISWSSEIVKKGKCGSKCNDVEKIITELKAAQEKLLPSKNNLKSILTKHFQPDEISNKKESDADEVGLEFIARADIEPEMTEAFHILIARRFGKVSTCYGLGTLTRQGENHPEQCWRVNDIAQEQQVHHKEYAKFLKNRDVNFITSPTLAEVKEELSGKKEEQSGKNSPISSPTPVP